MKHVFLMVPNGIGVGLTAVSLGLERAFEKRGIKTCLFNPMANLAPSSSVAADSDPSTQIQFLEQLLSQGLQDQLIENLISRFESISKDADIAIVQGIISTTLRTYAPRFNRKIAGALDAEVIFVTTPGNRTPKELDEQIEIMAQFYGGIHQPKVLGCIINKIGAPVDKYGNARFDLFELRKNIQQSNFSTIKKCTIFKQGDFNLIGAINWNRSLMAPRVIDIATFLGAEVLFGKDHLHTRRIENFVAAAATIDSLKSFFLPHSLIVTPGDRQDIILAACMAFLNGISISAILLTGGHDPSKNTLKLCERAFNEGLPVLRLKDDTLRTCIHLQDLDFQIPPDDIEKLERVKEYFSEPIQEKWIEKIAATQIEKTMTAPAFRYELTQRAKKAQKTIVLPEGYDPRILRAAQICHEKEIAKIVLFGEPQQIQKVAHDNGIKLDASISIIEPHSMIDKYMPLLLELRKHKGLNEKGAREQLLDPVVLATLMLKEGVFDGLVSGAVNTTAHTIRPALQLIRTHPDYKLVSSIFFMCLADKVLVYGDCAVNQNPLAEELADIAIQSADSAQKFGITPKIAMISYSTGKSGSGKDVDKVRQATEWVKKRRPDLLVDGPLQYDAAFSPEVAKKKAPHSPVAGQATVYVFPDLNTGNTTYKAVQRSADVLSIGPMLQGLNKPVNDLSRGATVDDIVYTITLTAIQAA